MALVSLPNNLVDGTTAYGSQVKANDDAIVAQVNGGLEDVNIKPAAAISGSKISNVAGNRIPTDRIENDAIDATKLADHASVDAQRAVTTDHVRDGAVIAAKIGAAAVIQSKVKLDFRDYSPGGVLPAGNTNSLSTGLTTAQGLPVYLEYRYAGAPLADHARCIGNIFLNTATSTYHIIIANTHTAGINLAGLTLRMWFIPAT